jgi:hypothetical protein
MDHLDKHNDQPKPYVWAKTAAEIFTKSHVRNKRWNHNTSAYRIARELGINRLGSEVLGRAGGLDRGGWPLIRGNWYYLARLRLE